MRYLAILLLVSMGVNAQTFTPTTGRHPVTINGTNCSYFMPSDYSTANVADLFFIANFVHVSNAAQADTIGLDKSIIAGFGGQIYKSDGTITQCVILTIPYMGFDASAIDAVIGAAIRSFPRLDTSHHERFGSMGYAGAGVSLQAYRRATGLPYNKLFDRHGVFVQLSASFADYPGTGNGAWWFWGASNYPDGNYPSSGTDYEYGQYSGNKKKTIFTLSSTANPITSIVDTVYKTSTLSTPTGSTAQNNAIRFLRDADDGIVYHNPIRGIVYKDMIDLVSGSGNVGKYFDEQGADPERGINTPTPITTDRANANNLIYFPLSLARENRAGVDLRGTYDLQRIWYYVGTNAYINDTIRFYTTQNAIDYKLFGKKRVPIGFSGWDYVDGRDTADNFYIGMHRGRDSVFNSWGTVELMEVIPYGDLIGTRQPAPPATVWAPSTTFQTIDNIMGVDLIGGYEAMKYIKPFKNVRVMNNTNYIMDSAYVRTYNLSNSLATAKFNLDHFNEERNNAYYRSIPGLIDSLNKSGKYITLDYNGGSQRLIDVYGVTGVRINTDTSALYHPRSYTESGRFFNTLGKLFGSTASDTNLLPTLYIKKFTGYNMNWNIQNGKNNVNISNGNELNGFFKGDDTSHTERFQPTLSYVAMSQADYDGWQGTLGSDMGLAAADPTIRLSTSSLFEIDSLLPQSEIKLSKKMRTDGKIIYGRIQFNNYPSAGGHQVHAVEFDYATKLRKFVAYLRSLHDWEIENTEFSGGDANTTSAQSAPLRTGSTWTDREWQAICNDYMLFAVSGSGLDRSYSYVLSTNAAEGNGGSFQNTDFIKSYPSIVLHPTWYRYANIARLLKGYRVDTLVQSTWNGKYILKLRNVAHPDSVAYAVGHASKDGTSLTNFTVNMGLLRGLPAVHDLSFVAETSTQIGYTLVNKVLTLASQSEKINIILARELRAPVRKKGVAVIRRDPRTL